MTKTTQPHVEPLLIPLIKEKYDGKPDKDFVKLKLRIHPTLTTSDLYEFKMSFFDNGEQGDFLLFVRNFNVTLATSGMLDTGANYKYICTLVRR